MARKGSTPATDEALDTSAETAEQNNEQAVEGSVDAGSAEPNKDDPQAPEHAESGEGEQAGSATGEATEHGAEAGESDQGALTAEGTGATTSHMEAVQRSGDLSGATGEIPPGSTGTRNPSPELANNLGQAEKTQMRTDQQVEDREAGAERRTERKMANDKESLEQLNQELREADEAVAEAVRHRDHILTQHDRLTERVSASGAIPFGEVTSDYFKASDARAEEEAKLRKTLLATSLASLIRTA
jgi:hypothetical protein